MQIYIIFMQFFLILCKKKDIFTLKNELLKHTDFISEWRKSCFQGLEISKFSGGGYLQTPLSSNPFCF